MSSSRCSESERFGWSESCLGSFTTCNIPCCTTVCNTVCCNHWNHRVKGDSMSLVHHLWHGPLRNWWSRHTAGLAPYLADIRRAADIPIQRLSRSGSEHAAQVGSIVGRLIETRVEPAPPYAAILGAGTRADATLWPTHAHMISTAEAAQAAEWRPTPAGWQHLVPGVDVGTHCTKLRYVAEIETNANADDIDQARAAGVVAELESAYRAAGPVVPVTAEAVADALVIMRRQHASMRYAERLCGGRLRGHAAPVMAPHWADGDIVLGPGRSGGYGLVDVKTVSRSTLTDTEKVTRWLWQLLSYAAADEEEDLWRIRALGLWLPRQDVLMMWRKDELWQAVGVHPLELAGLLLDLYQRDVRATFQ